VIAIQMRRIAVRFALLLAVAAVVPLVVYGAVSILSLRRGTHESVVAGNLNVATRAAEEIRRYIVLNAEILKALAADLQNTGLEPWQQDRILKNYVLQFHEFRELTLLDEAGGTVATSRIGKARVGIPGHASLTLDGVSISPLHVDADLLPTSIFAVRLSRLNHPAGWLVGEFNLEEMWRMVDRIRIGGHGYAMVIAPGGSLVAHGDPDKKALVAQARNVAANPLVAEAATGAAAAREYVDEDGRPTLGAAAAIPQLGWTVVVEQPTREAFANAAALQRQLIVSISTALLGTIVVGYLFGRSFIRPILTLQRATHAVAAGELDTRVEIRRADELGDLGVSFNTMADRLVALQEDIKKKERHAMFGRVAAGLVHDLSHPIQNIGNSARLLLRDDLDQESRELFRKTIDRELESLKRFMDDLRNLVKPRPVERYAMDINGPVADVVDSMHGEGERHRITIEASYASVPLTIEGDRFALGRVFRNLIVNAIQATQPGGRVMITTARSGDRVEVTVADTGSGIPRDQLPAIFEDFVTTKRRGLGLGLSISKRIVEQLDGTISVDSEVGRGTLFTLRFPAREDLSASAAAS
jgi:signal transduction histidine kinase